MCWHSALYVMNCVIWCVDTVLCMSSIWKSFVALRPETDCVDSIRDSARIPTACLTLTRYTYTHWPGIHSLNSLSNLDQVFRPWPGIHTLTKYTHADQTFKPWPGIHSLTRYSHSLCNLDQVYTPRPYKIVNCLPVIACIGDLIWLAVRRYNYILYNSSLAVGTYGIA